MNSNSKYPNINNFHPAHCISGQVMKCNRIVGNIFRKYLKPFKLTDSQLSLLFVITKGKDITQKKLSDILSMDKSTVNRNLRRLIENNYVSKENGSILTMTETGLNLLEEVLPHWQKAMDELNEIMGKDGVQSLSILMQKLTK